MDSILLPPRAVVKDRNGGVHVDPARLGVAFKPGGWVQHYGTEPTTLGRVRQAVIRTAARYPFGGTGLTGGQHSNTLWTGINEFGPIDMCADSGGLTALRSGSHDVLDMVATDISGFQQCGLVGVPYRLFAT